MNRTNFVGLDVHRKTVVATLLDEQGRVVDQRTMGPTKEELARYLESLPGETRVAMEACSMWESYFDAAESTGAEVVLSNPLKTRLIAEATIKTDKVDSEALATLLRLNALPTVYVPPPEIRRLRHLVRDRLFYRRKTTSLMSHAYGQLIHRGIPYEDGFLRHVRGRKEARALGIPELERAVDSIEFLLARCKEVDRELHSFFLTSREAQLLKSIPGIGELGAITLVAFLCPINRFASVDKLSSYCGMAPSTHQSGDFCYQGKLKHDCNPLVQTLLIELSWTHRQNEKKGDVAKVARRVGKQRGKGKGTVAAAHKLLKIAFGVLKRGTPYTHHAPERPAAMQQMRDPSRVAAMHCVRGTALGPVAADSLLAR